MPETAPSHESKSSLTEPTRPDILPKRGEGKYDVVKQMRKADSVKLLTARDPEKVMEDSGKNFEETFGLSRIMKAIKAIHKQGTVAFDLGTVFEQGEYRNRNWDDIYLFVSHYRKNFVRQEYPDMPTEQLDYETLKGMLQMFTEMEEAECPPIDFMLQFKDDHLLNVGDPFQRINQVLDESRVDTLDYESGEEAGSNKVRTVKELVDPVQNVFRWSPYENSYVGSINQLAEAWGHIEPGKDYDVDWLWGTFDPDTGEGEKGIKYMIDDAEDLTVTLQNNPSVENIRAAKDAWLAVQNKLYERKNHYWNTERKDVSKPQENYNTEFGLHPIDNYSKSVAYVSKVGAGGAAVLEYYRENIYPQLIHEFIEHLAEAHTLAFEGITVVETAAFKQYQTLWRNFLSDKGFDPDSYDPYSQDSKFVDNLSEFFLLHGTKIVEFIDEDLYDRIEEEASKAVNLAFPTKIKSKEAEFIKGIFPYTQELPAESYDRVLASWSVSAHMFPEMGTDMFVDEIWSELDRLLAPGGHAVFYPIGHYGESPQAIAATIDQYNQKYGRNLQYDLQYSGQMRYEGDDLFDGDMTLTVRKPL